MASPSGVLHFEEAETAADLQAEISLSQVESQELAAWHATQNASIELMTLIKENKMLEARALISKMYNETHIATDDFNIETPLYNRILTINKNILSNLGRLRQAYKGDPNEKNIESLERIITNKINKLFYWHSRSLQHMTEIRNLLWGMSTGYPSDIPRLLKSAGEIYSGCHLLIFYIHNIQTLIRQIEKLEIKEEHIEKREEHPFFK